MPMPPLVPNAFVTALPDHIVVDIVQQFTTSTGVITPTMARPYLTRQFRNEASGEPFNHEMVMAVRRLYEDYRDNGNKPWALDGPEIERRELVASWLCILNGEVEKFTTLLQLGPGLVPVTRLLPQLEANRDAALSQNDATLLPGPPHIRVETTMVPTPARAPRADDTITRGEAAEALASAIKKMSASSKAMRDDIRRAEDRAFLHGTSPVKKPKPGDVILYGGGAAHVGPTDKELREMPIAEFNFRKEVLDWPVSAALIPEDGEIKRRPS